ncbi:MAG TPA: type II 3-dehydroquinate dehydratase [Bacillota bacterium]|nr:type II 3-dehydroquinate dehydratase [Bacillota bacterium]
MKKILLLNGPNINMLGTREQDIYGMDTLEQIEKEVQEFGASLNLQVDCYQSNHEGDLIDYIHQAHQTYNGVVFNPAAYTHTSVALHDAIQAIDTPVVEVHLSNVHKRESFRHISYTAPACIGQIIGLGKQGYLLAVQALHDRLNNLH